MQCSRGEKPVFRWRLRPLSLPNNWLFLDNPNIVYNADSHLLASGVNSGVKINHYDWTQKFSAAYKTALERYNTGEREPSRCFTADQIEFLKSIGHTSRELFDFVDDSIRYGEPDYETALLVAAVRRDYYYVVQECKSTGQLIDMDALPAKTESVDGIVWLPRIIPKAEAKLRGEMPDDLMFGCGGDRLFFKTHGIHMADFLRHVWSAKGDHEVVNAYVKASSNSV